MAALEDDLRRRLRAAGTVAEACEAVVDVLREQGLELPSLYLERGGRLRCVAVRGYWQVFDGMPPEAGVIGSVFRTGTARELRDASVDGDYLAAALDAVDEVCVPVVLDGRTVGALNVESTTGLPRDALDVCTRASQELAVRLGQLGGVPRESAPQRLARVVAGLGEVDDLDELWAAACEGARDVAGSAGAAVVLAEGDGAGHRVAAAAGPLGSRLAAGCLPAVLGSVASWVESGSSVWTSDEPGGRGFEGSEELRACGAAGVVVVGLGRGGPTGARPGYLLVADEGSVEHATDLVELLELLAAHVTSCARTLSSLAALRRQAERDPLTDLGHHGAYQHALAAALPAEGAYRRVAALLLDVDDFKSVNDTYGHPGGDAFLRSAARLLSSRLRAGEHLYRVGGDEFSSVLVVRDEAEALAVARRLCAAAREELASTVSIGVAVSTPGESAAALVARADRALYEAKRAGRDRVRLAPDVVPPVPVSRAGAPVGAVRGG